MIQAKRQEVDVLVGVHLRRTDFAEYQGGAYYFDDKAYANWMRQLTVCAELAEQRVGFLLSSDATVHLEHFDGFNVFRIPDALSIEDLHALSACDYIMGPPSTFSMWASFYGNVPLRLFKFESEACELSQFSPIVALNEFANGQKLTHVNNDHWYMRVYNSGQ